jgi:hypothetical protein
MKAGQRSILAKAAVCALLATTTVTAKAQIGAPTKGQAAAIIGGLVGTGAAIGIGIYFAVHHGHSLTGCAVSASDGSLQLRTQGDPQTYALVGDVSVIKPGEHVRVSGKKQKKSAGAAPQFIVEALKKDYGACSVELASAPNSR